MVGVVETEVESMCRLECVYAGNRTLDSSFVSATTADNFLKASEQN